MDNNEIEVVGYSERGMINSLFYELQRTGDLKQLSELLSLAFFPFSNKKSDFTASKARIFIEQSFSDFGDADALLLLDQDEKKQSIFIEAKVKTSCRRKWSIDNQHKDFLRWVSDGTKKSSSDLFTQLYCKFRLIQALNEGGITHVESGVPFPPRSAKRKIGRNRVVRKVVKALEPYARDTLFVALIPCNDNEKFCTFFENTEKIGFQEELQKHGCNIERFGYILWSQVEKFCQKNNLSRTANMFEFNGGQIYI